MTKIKRLNMDDALFKPDALTKIKLRWSWLLLTRTSGPIVGRPIGFMPPFP
jgi:hypothetical protein